MKSARVIQAGCRLNQYESESLEISLRDENYQLTQSDHADLFVLNTCTVTSRADAKTRAQIRKLRAGNPNAKIVVTGCYASTDTKELSAMEEVDLVIPNAHKAQLDEVLAGKTNIDEDRFAYPRREREGRARAHLKIQDGCSKQCSYCKITQARGEAVSRPLMSTVDEARYLVEQGFHEVVLTGVNLGSYRDENGNDFVHLLKKVMEIPGNYWLRISSIEPADVTPELIELFQEDKIAPFLHVPVQSGSDRILKLMRRGYYSKHYRTWVKRAQEKIKNLHLGTDIIVGFPGETEEDFRETLSLAEEFQFANIHIFPFSLRKDTAVEEMLSARQLTEINGTEIRARIKRLENIAEKSASDYIRRTAGIPLRAIIETCRNGKQNAVTENYIKGSFPCETASAGEIVHVTYTETGIFSKIETD